MSQLGDRRGSVRLEVVGSLWATLELHEAARVVNRSDTGALLVSRTALPVDGVQPVQLSLDGRERLVTTRVRHLRRIETASGASEYLAGVEIVPAEPLDGAVE
jgi:hypothetical protein